MHKWNGVTANECIADKVLELKLPFIVPSAASFFTCSPFARPSLCWRSALIAYEIRSFKLFHNSLGGCPTIANFQQHHSREGRFCESSDSLHNSSSPSRSRPTVRLVGLPAAPANQPEIEGTSPNAELIVFARIKANRLLRLEIGLIKRSIILKRLFGVHMMSRRNTLIDCDDSQHVIECDFVFTLSSTYWVQSRLVSAMSRQKLDRKRQVDRISNLIHFPFQVDTKQRQHAR